MCIVSAAVTEVGEIKKSAGWCFMSWILDFWSRRIAAPSVYHWPNGQRVRIQPQSKPSSTPGRAEPQYPFSVNAVLLPLML